MDRIPSRTWYLIGNYASRAPILSHTTEIFICSEVPDDKLSLSAFKSVFQVANDSLLKPKILMCGIVACAGLPYTGNQVGTRTPEVVTSCHSNISSATM